MGANCTPQNDNEKMFIATRRNLTRSSLRVDYYKNNKRGRRVVQDEEVPSYDDKDDDDKDDRAHGRLRSL